MNKFFTLAVLVASVQFMINAIPIPGEAGFAISFTGTQLSPYAEIGGSSLPDVVGGTWSMEMWVFVDDAFTGFQPFVGHYLASGATNRNNGFVLQVWPNGQVCFFMGNGVSTNGGYGILIFGKSEQTKLQSRTWHHVAVTFAGPDVYPYTPDVVRVYLDGSLLEARNWNEPTTGGAAASGTRGQRNIPSQRPTLGRNDNQDQGFQVLGGRIDEFRIWNYELSAVQVADNMNARVAYNSEGLVVYHRFENTGANLIDETTNFPGTVVTVAGGDAIAYAPSAIVLDAYYNTKNTEIALIQLNAITELNTPVTYFISTLPTRGTLYTVSATGVIGLPITAATISFALPSNRVAYAAFENYVGIDNFSYKARDVSLSNSAAKVFINVASGSIVTPPPTGGCDGRGGQYDLCGECNGDGTSCTCVADQYRNYTLVELDRILVHYNIEYTLDLIAALNHTLDETLSALYSTAPTAAVNLGDAVEVIQLFNQECLSGFVDEMDVFLTALRNAN